ATPAAAPASTIPRNPAVLLSRTALILSPVDLRPASSARRAVAAYAHQSEPVTAEERRVLLGSPAAAPVSTNQPGARPGGRPGVTPSAANGSSRRAVAHGAARASRPCLVRCRTRRASPPRAAALGCTRVHLAPSLHCPHEVGRRALLHHRGVSGPLSR